jgi:hypothetical protein
LESNEPISVVPSDPQLLPSAMNAHIFKEIETPLYLEKKMAMKVL